MSLTRKPNVTVSSYQAIIEMLECMKQLISDPKTLEKISKDAYALPEREWELAQEARDNIGKYRSLVAEHDKKIAEIDELHADLDDKRIEVQSMLKSADDKNNKLALREKELARIEAENLAKDKDRNRRDVTLEADKRFHMQEVEKLIADKKAVAEFEKSLKSKAEQLRGLTEGL